MHLFRPARSFIRPSSILYRGLKHSQKQPSPFHPSPFRIASLIKARGRHTDHGPNQHTQGGYDQAQQFSDAEINQKVAQLRVKYLRPAIWAVTVSTGIYVLLAYLEAKEELKPPPAPQFRNPFKSRGTGPPTEVLAQYWKDLNPISKLSGGIIATNGLVHIGGFLVPKLWENLWHTPVLNRNFTLFTSTFVHSGPFHLLVNMWACHNFLLPVGYSRLFEGSPYHTLAFFLSTGVLSGYAQHLSTIFSNPAREIQSRALPSIMYRSGGASGALFAFFAAFCMQYPDAGVGIIFIPISVAASNLLPCVMAFDVYGMVRGFSSVNLGHAAHLGGALLGVGYHYFDGKNRIWKPLKQSIKRQLQKQ